MFTMAKIKDRSTISGMGKNSNYLDVHLIHNDYYSEKDTVEGEWYGNLVENFGLEEKTIKQGDKSFELLRKNINPLTKEKLTPRNREGGIRYFDFQCSAQKSVSIMANVLGDKRLIEAHRNAFFTAMIEFEKFAACRDNSTFGTIKEPLSTGNIIASVFHHDTSRALDPQLHTHCVVANVTYDPISKKYVALETCNIVKAIRHLGKVYQNQLAINVKKCGYDIDYKYDNKGNIEGFDIKGFSEELLKRYSKRRQDIEKEIDKFEEQKGRKPTSSEIHIITKLTRDKKLTDTTKEKLKTFQLNQLNVAELNHLSKIKSNAFNKNPKIDLIKNNTEIINYSIGNLFQRKSVINKHELIAEALSQGLGEIDLTKLIQDIDNHNEIVNLKDNTTNPYLNKITTVSGLIIEKYCIDKINYNENIYNPINKNYKPFTDPKSIHKEKFENFNFANHRKVIKEILSSKSKYHVIQGVAGAGKTTAMEELQKGLVSGGQKNIYYVAPTRSAVKAIFEKVTPDTMTLQKFFIDYNNQKLNIKDGYLVIDESSLKSNINGAQVLDIAEKNNMRILFVGDIRQHKAVDAGDFLRIIQEHSNIKVTTLDNIVRQKGKYKKAVSLMSNNQHQEGLDILDKDLGWVSESQGKYLSDAAEQYLSFTNDGKNLNNCLGSAPTHKECDKVTELIRNKLKENNILQEKLLDKEIFITHNWTRTQKTNIQNYHKNMKIHININKQNFKQNEIVTIEKIENNKIYVNNERQLHLSDYKSYDIGEIQNIEIAKGDIIQFRKENKKSKIINGEIVKVDKIDSNGNIVTSNNKIIDTKFKCLKHGYFMTSHKSQGLDRDYAVIAGQSLNKDSFYVGSSRGKKECRIFVPEKERLSHQLSRNTDRTAALDVIKDEKENKHRQALNNFIELRKSYKDKVMDQGSINKLDLCKFINKYNNRHKNKSNSIHMSDQLYPGVHKSKTPNRDKGIDYSF